MSSFRKYFSRTFFLGIALLLTSGAVTAQMVPAPYQQWSQYSWSHPYFGPNPVDLLRNLSWMQELLYRQLQAYVFPGPLYFGAMPPWGGNLMGSASNLQDMGDHYLVRMRLPGVTSRDIDMRLDGQVLIISVQAQRSQGTQANLGQWQTFFGNLQQVLIFPEAVDNSRIFGQFRDGLLTMVVPKIARMNR